MRLRTSLGLAAAVSLGLVQPSLGFVPPRGSEAPIVSAAQGPRTHRTTTWSRSLIPGWTAIVDHDTDVPLRMWGAGPRVANAVADATVAEAAARQFLAAHLATLAPGSAPSDFELVSNTLSDGVRSVGFAQRVRGLRVLGGAIGFAFKHDRLVMVTSTALPDVQVTTPVTRLRHDVLVQRAAKWLAADGHTFVRATASFAPSEQVIVPVVRPRRGARPEITYRVAEHLELEAATSVGRWDVWLDAADASPIARKSRIHYATGKVLFNVGDRHPAGTRSALPAAFASHVVNGAAATSTADGSITWAGTTAATVALTLEGPYVSITNQAGARLTENVSLAPNATFTWSRASDELGDAQIAAFVHANIAKQFTREHITTNLAWLNQPLGVYVNEQSTCNAYSTGDDIHFFRKGNQCENTGRMADVVYHEFGHSLHAHAIIDGVGAFDGALSEGMSDMFAALITRDHGMGRGFFFTDAPLRDLDNEKRWPDDVVGQVHSDGEIIGAAMWHLGEALETKLGAQAGHAKTADIFWGILQRASDIPSSYAEALLADDDDGDLANGTPNQCEINNAFGRHGLADPTVTVGLQPPVRDGFDVSITIAPPAASACPGPGVSSAILEWKPRGGTGGSVALTADGNTYRGSIPAQPDGTVVQYKVKVTLEDGASISYPQNRADQFYEMYVGEVTTLWCSDFEAGLDGWTHGASVATRDEWEVGEPLGLGGDPKTAHGGTKVLGIDLSQDGLYRARLMTFAETPEIDLAGHTKVRLQYYRWLGVEDGFYDKAKILANGTQVWRNYGSVSEPQANGVDHVDREWRFQDVDLSEHAASGKLKLRFELQSDEGLELAGWTLDDVCVVALTGPAATCGNSTVDDGESCDDGNRVDGDGCDMNCVDETTGGDGGGCCSVGGGPEGALALSLFTLGMLFRRRRARVV